MNRNNIRRRIEDLKQSPWSFEIEDELYHLRNALSSEMGIPSYLRI